MNIKDYKLHIIVEDDGLAHILRETLAMTLLPVPEEINIVEGGGWTSMFVRYNELIEKGVDSTRIIPILDGDTVADRNPRSGNDMLLNPSLVRLYKDLEYAYDNWMVAEAIVEMDSLLFDGDFSPKSLVSCLSLIISARRNSSQGRIPFYVSLENECKEYYERRGGERTAFVLPTKVELAKKIAEISLRNRIFPEQLDKIVQHVESVASAKGIELLPIKVQLVSHITETVKSEPELHGKILISVGGRFLWVLDLDVHKFYRVPSDDRLNFGKASWSPDGEMIACAVKAKGVLIIKSDGTGQRTLSRNVSYGYETNPCWFPTGQSILINTELGLCRKNLSSIDWPIVFPTDHGTIADDCVSRSGRIAVNHYNRTDGKYYLHVGGRDATMPYERVPNINDTRAGVSWSPDGRTVAFVNQIDSERGAVCVYDNGNKKTRFVSSHDGLPRYVSFSPDGRFVVYTWQDTKTNYQELRAVDVISRKITILMTNVSDFLIGCHAWRY